MNQERIGKFISEERNRHGLTQAELGEKLGVTDKTIGNWEHARSMPDISILKSICIILDLELDELLDGKRKSIVKEKSKERLIKNNKLIGLTIYNRRVELGISQYDLGNKVYLTRTAICRLEKGDYYPSLSVLIDICDVLDLKIEDVIYY